MDQRIRDPADGAERSLERADAIVVLPIPYLKPDGVTRRVCQNVQGKAHPIEVMCSVPSQPTTRGEALMVLKIADDRSWKKVIVISWQCHLPRARLIFRQCFSDPPGGTVMQAGPRRYEFGSMLWAYVYAYQWGGFAKAVGRGKCSRAGIFANSWQRLANSVIVLRSTGGRGRVRARSKQGEVGK